MYSVTRKLKALKPMFRQQRREKGDLAMNVKPAAGFLEVAQILLQSDRHNSLLLQLENCCRLVYLKATQLEHVMLRQRAKLQWLKGGDQCSKVFFRRVATRRANKCLFQISNSDGLVQTNPTTISSVFVTYFQNLLGGDRTDRAIDLNYLRPWARHILTEEEACALIRPVSVDDVKTAMFDIEEDKAPGPYGFSSGFYKAAWPIVGKEISKAIMDFFTTGRLLKQVNATLLTLIPKCQLPPRCALKVDLRKAYDTVEWDFLFATLRLFGFPAVFIKWIEECVTSAHYSVVVNGGMHGFFAGARGLRQGDPMSPYSFVLVMEVLQMILQQFIDQDGQFLYHWRCTELKLFQLSFVDDLLLLCKADVRSEGHLPVGYLGLPLISSRLSIADCQPLLQKIDSRIKGWEGVQLSFAGRVQLIKSVLVSLEVYWATAFILPKGIINEMIKRLRTFLWKGTSSSSYPKVAWEVVCRPIEEGGQAYDLFRTPGPKVVWSSLLLGPFKIPKNCFILWLAIMGDCPHWINHGFKTDSNCTLCPDGVPETHDHLFFTCSFSRRVLTIIRQQIPFLWPYRDWQRGIHWASSRWRGKHVVNAAFRSLLASLVYHIWQERNSRRFQQRSRTPSIVGNLVVEELRQRIISVQLRQSVSTLGLYRLWKIPWSVEGLSS
ncbi:Retrovirus-related Pol polyprotein from type-2 retrotransposable element R2DM [Sesamum angolense]|uniref:Retrovirus-related Pol polyprotein from type-2 retrotransposable element R2DM n=1 Tax=Sesamum angolense TaxID=2727404 RepID=A0AAE1T9Q0_9LAMI|nr:Retrovirus-related Pol polyprotein from type-2 retrotransposable element R2DM [Sesamum angolense]